MERDHLIWWSACRLVCQIPWPESEFYGGPAAWTKYKVASTVYKDSEYDASLPRDNKYARRPAVSLDRYIEDSEPARRKDLVTWISSGLWHIPQIEDWPLTVAQGRYWAAPHPFIQPSRCECIHPSVRCAACVGVCRQHAGFPGEAVQHVRAGPLHGPPQCRRRRHHRPRHLRSRPSRRMSQPGHRPIERPGWAFSFCLRSLSLLARRTFLFLFPAILPGVGEWWTSLCLPIRVSE